LFAGIDPWKAAVIHQEKSKLVMPLWELCIPLPKSKMVVITVVVCCIPGFPELNRFVSAEKSEGDLLCGQCCSTAIELQFFKCVHLGVFSR